LFLLLSLNCCGVDRTILSLFYRTIIHSVMSYTIICWYPSATKQAMIPLNKVTRIASKLLGSQICLPEEVKCKTINMLNKILADETHCLHDRFEHMPSGRLRGARQNSMRYGKTFIPRAIQVYNTDFRR